MAYGCFQEESQKSKGIQCRSTPNLSYYGNIKHSLLVINSVNERNVYLEFKKINVRFFIFLKFIFSWNFCRGPLFYFVAYERSEKEVHMKEQKTQSMQNRFSAYVVAAVSNRRARYLENKNRNKGRKYAVLEMLDLTYTDFSEEFNKYVMEQIIQESQDISKLEEIIRLTQGQKMIYAIACLKEREKKLIFGRVFEELEFEELGKRLGITGKQAEMAYYYVIRKMRRRMEGTTDEF